MWIRHQVNELAIDLLDIAETPDQQAVSQIQRTYIRGMLDMLKKLTVELDLYGTADAASQTADALNQALGSGESFLSQQG